MRRTTAWLSSIPLILAGTLAAHSLAYRIAYPVADARWRLLASTGHGYLGYVPLIAGTIVAAVLAGSLAMAADAVRGKPFRAFPAWAFALLPVLAFTVQEFTERWVAGGGLPWWMVLQPTFRIGLLLQLPFALVAFLVARLLLRTARAIGRILRGQGSLPIVLPAVPRRASSYRDAVHPKTSIAGLGWGLRGPPLHLL